MGARFAHLAKWAKRAKCTADSPDTDASSTSTKQLRPLANAVLNQLDPGAQIFSKGAMLAKCWTDL
eukprot:15447843-Alexandrium_andersonii.AAC.1